MPVDAAFHVRAEGGAEIGPLSRVQLLEGIRSGWVRLEDEVRLHDGEWKSIRYSLCETDFAFAVFADPAKRDISLTCVAPSIVSNGYAVRTSHQLSWSKVQ